MGKTKVRSNLLSLTEGSILLAVVLVMAFTPLGYIKTAGLEISLITVPVVFGAIFLGFKASTFLGFVFGLTSFIQAATGMSAFGLLLFEQRPIATFFVCVVTRTLMGLLVGLLVIPWNKKDSLPCYLTAGISGPLLNTLFFMSALLLFFWKTDLIQNMAHTFGAHNVFAFCAAFVGVNGIVEAICCPIITVAICPALAKLKARF